MRDAERSVRHLATMFAGRRARDIETELIEAYKDARLHDHGPIGAPIRPATVNRELAALRRMFSLARKNRKGFRHHPEITPLAEDNVREMFVEPALFDAVARELRTRDPDIADGIEFAYGAAWRKREVFDLKLADVEWRADDLSAAVLRLRRAHSKNKRDRVLPLRGVLLTVVRRRWMLRRLDCPYLFHRNGRPIRDFRIRWKQACEAAGVVAGRAGLIVHDLRRSAIRNIRRANVSEREAMLISGHRTRAVFDRYNIVSEDDLAEAVARTSAYSASERQRHPSITALRPIEEEVGQNADSAPVSGDSGARRGRASR